MYFHIIFPIIFKSQITNHKSQITKTSNCVRPWLVGTWVIAGSYLSPSLKSHSVELVDFNGSSQKSLVIKIFAVGHSRLRDRLGLLLKTTSSCRFYKKAVLFCRNSTLIKEGDWLSFNFKVGYG